MTQFSPQKTKQTKNIQKIKQNRKSIIHVIFINFICKFSLTLSTSSCRLFPFCFCFPYSLSFSRGESVGSWRATKFPIKFKTKILNYKLLKTKAVSQNQLKQKTASSAVIIIILITSINHSSLALANWIPGF